MKLTPRIILGIAASALIITTIAALSIRYSKNQNSYLLLNSDQNRFNLNFSIQKSDQENFITFLSNLGIPSEAQGGVHFELDSTSSAKLSFLSPVKANLKFRSKGINFWAETQIPAFANQADIEQIKIPKTTNLAIFAPNLANFIKARLNIPDDLKIWFEKNLSNSKSSYLLIYNQNADFSLLLKRNDMDFDPLKNLKDSNGDSIYKEETGGDTKLHLLQIPSFIQEGAGLQTLAFFQLGDYRVLSSSPDAAKSFIDSQKSTEAISFPKEKSAQQASLALEYSNTTDDPAPAKLADFLLLTWQGTSYPKSKIADSLKRIKYASFTLNEEAFSGLINLQ